VLVILTESIVRSKLLQRNSYSAYHSVLPYLGGQCGSESTNQLARLIGTIHLQRLYSYSELVVITVRTHPCFSSFIL